MLSKAQHSLGKHIDDLVGSGIGQQAVPTVFGQDAMRWPCLLISVPASRKYPGRSKICPLRTRRLPGSYPRKIALDVEKLQNTGSRRIIWPTRRVKAPQMAPFRRALCERGRRMGWLAGEPGFEPTLSLIAQSCACNNLRECRQCR